jgi:hypothetical protein
MSKITTIRLAAICFGLVLLCTAPVEAKDKLPEVSDDGLHLVKDSDLRTVYVKPGASFDQYDKVAILDCYVEFRKHWQRDYNNSVVGTGRRISKEDMERIQKEVADEFKKLFTEELETKGGHEVVNYAAEDVLVLRPAIINLDVTAPDKLAPGMSVTFVASAGQMTLYLELYDSVTSTLLARAIDPEAARRHGGAQLGNRVANKAEADRILRRWAGILRDHLDAVKTPAAKD